MYLRSLNSSSSSYDSRIYEGGTGSLTTANGQGKLVLEANNVETTGSLKSRYYNDSLTTSPPSTLIGNNTEYIKIRYENALPVQGGHIILKSNYSITLDAPYININGTLNRNLSAPVGIEDFYSNNNDTFFEINSMFNQVGWG